METGWTDNKPEKEITEDSDAQSNLNNIRTQEIKALEEKHK